MNTTPYKNIAKVFGITAIIIIPILLSGYFFVFQSATPASFVPSDEVKTDSGAIVYQETGQDNQMETEYTTQPRSPHDRNRISDDNTVYTFTESDLPTQDVEHLQTAQEEQSRVLLEETETFQTFSGDEVILYNDTSTPHTHAYIIDTSTQYTETGQMYHSIAFGGMALLIFSISASIIMIVRLIEKKYNNT